MLDTTDGDKQVKTEQNTSLPVVFVSKIFNYAHSMIKCTKELQNQKQNQNQYHSTNKSLVLGLIPSDDQQYR